MDLLWSRPLTVAYAYRHHTLIQAVTGAESLGSGTGVVESLCSAPVDCSWPSPSMLWILCNDV